MVQYCMGVCVGRSATRRSRSARTAIDACFGTSPLGSSCIAGIFCDGCPSRLWHGRRQDRASQPGGLSGEYDFRPSELLRAGYRGEQLQHHRRGRATVASPELRARDQSEEGRGLVSSLPGNVLEQAH